MRSSRRKLLSRLMCFVMGLSCGTNAGAHQKKKSSSNESLNLPEWIIVGSTSMMLYKIILKPLGSKLLDKVWKNSKNKLHVGNGEQKNINYMGINNENYKKIQQEEYIEKVLDSIDKTVDEGLEHEYLKTIPNSLGRIRMALHCLFLHYSNKNGKDIKNAKLTIGEKIDWSFTYGKENYVSLDDVREILEWYCSNNILVFSNDLTPIKKFGFVIQEWVKKMDFKSVEIVMDGVGGPYAGDHWKSSVKFKIHGFKYKLSDDERMSLRERLGLKDIDTLEVFNDNEVIEIKGENMGDNNEGDKIIVLENLV